MKRGGIFLIGAAILASTACLGSEGKLEIRSTSSGLKPGDEPVPFRIAEARGHLALGNVGLALEGFRKAAREKPASVDALTGIARCYDRMGRFDLSRRHYEMALAIAPRDPVALALFASSLESQGLSPEAAAVRREMVALAAAEERKAEIETAGLASVGSAEAVAPVREPPAAAAPVGQTVTIVLPPALPKDTARPQPADPAKLPVVVVGKSVMIALPPPRPAPAAKAPARLAALPAPVHRKPRIERLSLTEVALITGNGPRWKRPDAQPARAGSPVLAEIRLLNAARVDRLAARTQAYLGRFGWRQIRVGDAAAVRPRSLILYPNGAQAAAKRLSARLGFPTAPRNDVRQLTILLGRDAAAHPALHPRT